MSNPIISMNDRAIYASKICVNRPWWLKLLHFAGKYPCIGDVALLALAAYKRSPCFLGMGLTRFWAHTLYENLLKPGCYQHWPMVGQWGLLLLYGIGDKGPVVPDVDDVLDDIHQDDDTAEGEGIKSTAPWIVRKYVQKLQLEFGVPLRNTANELMMRKTLQKWFKEDTVRHADQVTYQSWIVELAFVPTLPALGVTLLMQSSLQAQKRRSIYDAFRPTLN